MVSIWQERVLLCAPLLALEAGCRELQGQMDGLPPPPWRHEVRQQSGLWGHLENKCFSEETLKDF